MPPLVVGFGSQELPSLGISVRRKRERGREARGERNKNGITLFQTVRNHKIVITKNQYDYINFVNFARRLQRKNIPRLFFFVDCWRALDGGGDRAEEEEETWLGKSKGGTAKKKENAKKVGRIRIRMVGCFCGGGEGDCLKASPSPFSLCLGVRSQPATVACKMEPQLEYVHAACMFLHVSCRFCMLSRWLFTKFLHRSSGESLSSVRCWLGCSILGEMLLLFRKREGGDKFNLVP